MSEMGTSVDRIGNLARGFGFKPQEESVNKIK